MSTSQDRDNPFAPPTAAVLEPAALGLGQYVPGGRKVPAGRGVAWFGEAWDLFKRSPRKWVVILIAFLLISIVLAVLPLRSHVNPVEINPKNKRKTIPLPGRGLKKNPPIRKAHPPTPHPPPSP